MCFVHVQLSIHSHCSFNGLLCFVHICLESLTHQAFPSYFVVFFKNGLLANRGPSLCSVTRQLRHQGYWRLDYLITSNGIVQFSDLQAVNLVISAVCVCVCVCVPLFHVEVQTCRSIPRHLQHQGQSLLPSGTTPSPCSVCVLPRITF